MAGTRYAKQPRVGERLFYAEDDQWPITAVHAHGLRITAVDRLGRVWDMERAERGVWFVAPGEQVA